MDVTPRWHLPFPEDEDTPDVPRDIRALAESIDDVGKDLQGLFAARPTAGKTGRYYYAVDDTSLGVTGTLYRDNGTSWDAVTERVGPRVRVYRTTTQSIPNATFTAIAWEAEVFDTDNMHDNVTNNSRLKCVSGPGAYLATACMTFSGTPPSGSGGFRMNGSSFIWYGSFSGGIFHQSGPIQMAVNDYVEVVIAQSSGAAATVNPATGPVVASLMRIAS